MREDVLQRLANQATSDRTFLSHLRRDPGAALKAHGYALTQEEFATVLDLRRRTAALGDGTVAALLAGGLSNRAGGQPANPRAPGGPFAGPGRPGVPAGLTTPRAEAGGTPGHEARPEQDCCRLPRRPDRLVLQPVVPLQRRRGDHP